MAFLYFFPPEMKKAELIITTGTILFYRGGETYFVQGLQRYFVFESLNGRVSYLHTYHIMTF